jgi:uncharacterized membrane protein
MPEDRPDLQERTSLRTVILLLLFTLFLGLLVKLPCASGDWSDGRPYRRFCYTDIVPLYRQEGLAAGRFPYLSAPNEYPVGTGVVMGLAARLVDTDADFFLLNVAVLALAAAATTVLLYRMVGRKALYFALAPTLLLYGFLNWDLLAVALATAGTYAYLSRRDVAAGVLLGLGAAAKVYPALLLLPFVLGRVGERRSKDGMRMTAAAAGAWLAANLPFAILGFRNWGLFFRFNSSRGVEWSTLWFAACHRLGGSLGCGRIGLLNLTSVALLALGLWVNWRLKGASTPGFERWTFGLPLLVVLLLTTKVYSPQYSLWLLPWFALVLPDLRLFLAFEAADVAVFFTEFSWLGRHTGFGGLPVGALEIAALARAVVLVAILAAYLRRSSPEVSLERRGTALVASGPPGPPPA